MPDGTTAWSKFLARLMAGAGFGVPSVFAVGRATGQTAANSSVAAHTVAATADGTFEISFNLLITTSTTHSFQVECAYTDEGNSARVQTMGAFGVGGAAVSWTFADTGGAIAYQGIVTHIRCKAGTTITIRTSAGGTYTTVVYNIEGVIKQIA